MWETTYLPSRTECLTVSSGGKTKSQLLSTIKKYLRKVAGKQLNYRSSRRTSTPDYSRANSFWSRRHSKHRTVVTSGCGSRSLSGKGTSSEGLFKMSPTKSRICMADRLSRFGKGTSLTISGSIPTISERETQRERLFSRWKRSKPVPLRAANKLLRKLERLTVVLTEY